MTAVVGREAELASLRAFLAHSADGAGALVLDGEAGMGKTTLWQAGVEASAELGLRVLRALPAESETALSFSGLGDLLDGVLAEALAPLPGGQATALSRALVLEDEATAVPDAHAVGVAALNALRGLVATGPVVIAIDDVQWLDDASAATLAYASRRLRDEPVRLLCAKRRGMESALLDELRRSFSDRFVELDVGPLDARSLHRVVQERLGVVLPRPLLAEVHEAAGGNPFYALEIVRTLQRSDVSIEAGQPIPVPDSLHELVRGRLLELPPESRDFLLAAAAHAHPEVGVVEAATGVGRSAGLAPALSAGIVELAGQRIRFTHPLLAAGAYDLGDSARRVEIHARLADLLDDPEARAWQLAASVDEPGEGVADALEEAAQHARARGAPRPAALLLDRARELTPAWLPREASRRAVDAAYLHYEAGDSIRAEAQLRDVIAQLPEGSERARALTRLARVRAYEALPDAAALFLQAVAEAGDDVEALAVAHLGVADCFWYSLENLEDALVHATTATELALGIGDEGLASEALGNRWTVTILLGRDEATALGEEALAAQSAAVDRRILTQPRFIAASDFMWLTGAFDEARRDLRALLELAREIDESSVPLALFHLAHVENELGDFASALEHALEGREAADQAGQRTSSAFNLALESYVGARLGLAEEARASARAALEVVPTAGGRRAELLARSALGHLDLVEDSLDAAVESLAPLLAFVRSEVIAEPCAMPFVVDLVEALVALGRTEQALDELEWYEEAAGRLGRPTALANCARCRGLLAAQAGDPDGALASFEQALTLHAQVELPLDRGRTLLALGAVQRRLKRRREARATLEEALGVFERIGAALWAERARAELKRISGRAASPGALTPAEARVAALVAEGKTNKEVAAALYLSDRTVEGHLAHVFGKLGIRHRTEVAGALHTRGIEPSNTGDAPVSAENAAP